MTRSRSFVVTDFECLTAELFTERYAARYMCGALETCPTTGKEHMQAVVYYDNARSVSALGKKRKNNVEPVRGEFEDAIGYCAKGTREKPQGGYRKFLEDPCENFWEVGDRPQQGKRSDLDQLHDAIRNGASVESVAQQDPEMYHQYGRTLEKLEDIYLRSKHRTTMTTCEWLWGPTGVGKSHIAFQNFTPETHYVHPIHDKGWWDGYTGQQTVIINEFRGQIPYSELLCIVDKWPYSVRRRNRAPMPFTSTHVIITSALPPEDVYHNIQERDSIDQLLRRITVRHIQPQGRTDP